MRNKILMAVFGVCLLCLVCVMGGSSCQDYVNKKSPESRRAEIKIECNGKTVTYKDELINPTDHIVADETARRKINAPLTEKLKTVDSCINAGAEWRQAFLYSFPLLHKTVESVIKENTVEPIDSTIKFQPDSRPLFIITREKVGREINETRLYQDIYISLRRSADVKIKVVPLPVAAKVSAADNIKLTNLRSKFTTDFSASNDNRKHNIALSLSMINGKVIMPKQEFSFNKTVGRRIASRGFLEAKIINNGEYILGFGGGVCQTSTTLYNAALRADMEITMVRNHSIAPTYVPPSFDAMVNSESSDLRFINNSDTPVFVKAVAENNTATVEFYGVQLPYRIGVKSVEISRGEVPEDQVVVDVERKHVDMLAAAGERVRVSYGHAALKSEGYLIYYDLLGREIRRTLIRSDIYNMCRGIIAVAP